MKLALLSLFVALAFCLSAVSWADSDINREKKNEIQRLYRILNITGFGPKWRAYQKSNMYVYVTAGSGYVDISAITLFPDYSKFGNDLYSAVRASGESAIASSYGMTEPGFAIAALINKSAYGAKEIKNHFRL